jgi:hypothetical protein
MKMWLTFFLAWEYLTYTYSDLVVARGVSLFRYLLGFLSLVCHCHYVNVQVPGDMSPIGVSPAVFQDEPGHPGAPVHLDRIGRLLTALALLQQGNRSGVYYILVIFGEL